jgi:predicted enzyme related to lactoylglutathione lyase
MTPQIRRANVVWFELPVRDMDRATAFYETVFGIKMVTNELFQMIKVCARELR